MDEIRSFLLQNLWYAQGIENNPFLPLRRSLPILSSQCPVCFRTAAGRGFAKSAQFHPRTKSFAAKLSQFECFTGPLDLFIQHPTNHFSYIFHCQRFHGKFFDAYIFDDVFVDPIAVAGADDDRDIRSD